MLQQLESHRRDRRLDDGMRGNRFPPALASVAVPGWKFAADQNPEPGDQHTEQPHMPWSQTDLPRLKHASPRRSAMRVECNPFDETASPWLVERSWNKPVTSAVWKMIPPPLGP